jgi:UDP-N-acetylmuramate--alanine ligase
MPYNKFSNFKRIHFIGIGGIGMSGIAKLMYSNGYTISGSDPSHNAIITQLVSLGIHVFSQHAAANIANVDVVVFSGAIPADNAELLAAKKNNIPILSRAEMLAELMRFKFGIAVAGTHGKTTTTSIMAHIFRVADLDPTYVIGGVLNSTNKNAALGKGEYFIAEADESDASFLNLSPMLAVITNIDIDHMETYNNSSEEQEHAFLTFLRRLPFYGNAILYGDDARITNIVPQLARAITTYGLTENNDFYAENILQQGMETHFTVVRKNNAPLHVKLSLPGIHNVLNSLAAIAVADICGISDIDKCKALTTFAGVARRFQVLGRFDVENKNITIVEDYGHHPTEIDVTLNSARAVFVDKRIVLVFQPHRYSRTKDLWHDFIRVLSKADKVILLDIYPGGEKPIEGISNAALAASMPDKAIVANEAGLLDILQREVLHDDIVFFGGAGSISKICHDVIAKLAKTE